MKTPPNPTEALNQFLAMEFPTGRTEAEKEFSQKVAFVAGMASVVEHINELARDPETTENIFSDSILTWRREVLELLQECRRVCSARGVAS